LFLADGYWSNYFDGSSSSKLALTPNSSLRQDLGDWTLEGYVYIDKFISGLVTLVNCGNLGVSYSFLYSINTSGAFYVETTTGNYTSSSNAILLNQWNHFAFVRSGTTFYMYANGVRVFTQTSATFGVNALGTFLIGAYYNNNHYLTGSISNLRFVQGTALYTGSTYTVPTAPLTAITNTSLLTCQSNYFKDNSSNNFAITATGTPSVQPFSPFAPTSAYSTSVNGGSMYFDGTGDYLTFSSISLTADFTVECWVYKTAVDASGYTNLFSGGTTQWIIDLTTAGSIALYLGGTAILAASGTAVVANAWNHISFVREGTTVRGYVNGIQQVTGTSSSALPISYLGAYSGGGYEMNGCVSNVRILNGTCLYPSGTTFTPPTAPLTAITNTSLLLNGTNAGIYDNAIKNDLETVGNAQVSTSVVKYGTGSMYFDGTTTYVQNGSITSANRASSLQYLLGNFTIECWLYPLSASTDMMAAGDAVGINSQFFRINQSSAGDLSFYPNANWFITTGGGGKVPVNQWTHVACTRSGTTAYLFANGVLLGTTTVDPALGVCVQKVGAYSNGAANWNGYIDDFRVTKGIARYTANFTPPTSAFPNQ
jgi:hypothetical protein